MAITVELFNFPTDLSDLVLVKRENVFYRCKVVDYDDADFSVYYLDYGYQTLARLKDIYQWHPMWSLVPGILFEFQFMQIKIITHSSHFIQLKRSDASWKIFVRENRKKMKL